MKKDHQQSGEIHQPVLANEVLALLEPKSGESFLDLTAGYGGHAELVLSLTKSPDKATLVDRDERAIGALRQKFGNAEIVHSDFLAACQALVEDHRRFDMVLVDLGVSSPQLDQAERGFSFTNTGPLDMRMDQRQELTAEWLLNNTAEDDLAKIIKDYGQEHKALSIAKHIVAARPISSTSDLAKIVTKSYGRWAKTSRKHPATRTFQAIRIAVNQELDQLAKALELMVKLLAPGGRLAIISFHSLEDRIVKHFFADQAGERYDADLRPLTKKPLTAGKHEISLNPRARSAKLRAVAKIKNQ